ncbi:MAG TPA: amidohydrolase family protein [Burkholderiales bacterium]|nr:amidohydrolase family protein [Burkholderiales bacterium]
MCILCDKGIPQNHTGSQLGRRDFLKASTATAAAAAGMGLFAARPAAAHDDDEAPRDSGRNGRRYVIRNGHVMSMDPAVGDIVRGDVLVEGKKIVAVGRNLHAGGADEIDAEGRIVMPGFVDTHHHQFETAIRSFIADGLLFNDGQPHGAINYFQYILGTFAPVYRPRDVHISELFGSLSQLDAGVTTSHDISQIHYSKEHSEAAIKGSADSDRRIVFGFFEGARADLLGSPPGAWYPEGAIFLRNKYFSSSNQLMTMTMGGEIYLLPNNPADPRTYIRAWQLGRQLGLPVAAHIVGSFGMEPEFTAIAAGQRPVRFGADNLFIHMTGMSDPAWNEVKRVGAGVSLAVPIEMNMRHGTPPILTTLEKGISPSLSVDVEVTLTADMFTQMRSAMNLHRLFMNAKALGEPYATGFPQQELLTSRDVLRFATQEGANDLKLGAKVGSLTPGKEADIIILDAEAINVAPLNVVPGAVVSLMDRSNVETVIVAGKVRKWKGKLLDVDLRRLRGELEDSRDFLFGAAGITQDLFRPN